jgi:hypothetical protein
MNAKQIALPLRCCGCLRRKYKVLAPAAEHVRTALPEVTMWKARNGKPPMVRHTRRSR